MNSRSLVLVALILFSILVLVFYVQPRIAELREKEASLAMLKNTVSQTTELNNLLSSHLAKIDSIRTEDLQKIEHFLPQNIDVVLVTRDITSVARRNNLTINTMSIGENNNSTARNGQVDDGGDYDRDYRVTATALTLSFFGSYADIKNFIEQIEFSAYPIKFTELEIKPRRQNASADQSSFTDYIVTMNVELYSFNLR